MAMALLRFLCLWPKYVSIPFEISCGSMIWWIETRTRGAPTCSQGCDCSSLEARMKQAAQVHTQGLRWACILCCHGFTAIVA